MDVKPGSKNVLSDPSSPGPGYVFFRVVSVITLIAMWAILAQVFQQYNQSGRPTPSPILYLFIVGIIASVWSFAILVTFLRANNVSYFIVFWDVVGMILLIVGVSLITKPAYDDCAALTAQLNSGIQQISTTGTYAGVSNPRPICNLLRAAWGLAIANIVFFFLMAALGYSIVSMVADEYKRLGGPVARRTVIEEGYPVQPQVRNVTQTTTASVPIAPQPVIVEEKVRRKRSKSRDGGRKHKHSSSKDKSKRRSSRSEGADVYIERSSRRESRH